MPAAARGERGRERRVGDATLLVTMGCGDACPHLPGLERADWDLPDPKGQPPAEVRAIRDQTRRRVADLVASHGWSPPQS